MSWLDNIANKLKQVGHDIGIGKHNKPAKADKPDASIFAGVGAQIGWPAGKSTDESIFTVDGSFKKDTTNIETLVQRPPKPDKPPKPDRPEKFDL